VGGETLKSLHFLNPETGWAVGDGVIYSTIDGGSNWVMRIAPVYGNLAFLDQLSWVSVGGGGTILRSADGGMNWTKMNSTSKELLHSVCFSEGTGYAVGGNMTILKVSLNTSLPSLNGPDEHVKLYPNPVKNLVTIETNGLLPSAYHFSVYAISGQKMLHRTIIDKQVQLDVSHLPSGIYLVKVGNEQFSGQYRLIKQ